MLQPMPGISPQTDTQRIPVSMRTYDIVSKIAYLIGVKQSMFERDMLKLVWYEKLQEMPQARIIRCLCKIRTVLLKKYEEIDLGIKYQMENLDRMPDLFDADDFKYLESQNISVLKANYRVNDYIADVNRYISENIFPCRGLFPLWIKWDYIRDMFIMPNGTKEEGVRKERLKYKNNFNTYPFHTYINWLPGDNGNILYNDGKFVSLLYAAHGDQFTEFDKVIDAGSKVTNGLYGFISSHESIAIVVDCENSDPYKLCAVLRNITNNCENDVGRIKKIILYDDIHTASTWRILDKYIDIPIEHELIERVNDYKSLVDIRMTAGTCKEFYQNQINAFIIVSSDSDYWGLISALPSASFLVMAEYEKCGESLRGAMDSAGIFYCYIDDFCKGNINDIKIGALLAEVKQYVESGVRLNVNAMLDSISSRIRIDLSPSEKKSFRDRLIKNMKLSISDEGDVRIVVGNNKGF